MEQLPELKATIMKRKEQNKAVRKPYHRQRQTTTIPHRHMKDYFFDDVPVPAIDLDASQTPSKMEESGIGDDGKDNFIDFDINFSMADLL